MHSALNTMQLSVLRCCMKDESADARRILTAVPQSEWRRPVGRPHSSWMATLKNDLSLHNLAFEDAIEMALDKPLWGLLAASGATHWWCMPNNDEWWCLKSYWKFTAFCLLACLGSAVRLPDWKMNDRRGIVREACSHCNCECYELPVNPEQNACVYCGCPPTQHVKIHS